jgi:hypothetical protein
VGRPSSTPSPTSTARPRTLARWLRGGLSFADAK